MRYHIEIENTIENDMAGLPFLGRVILAWNVIRGRTVRMTSNALDIQIGDDETLFVPPTVSQDLLKICEEIANDPRCDLITSERRLRLYGAIHNAGGTLDGRPTS